jgi:Ca2+/Na+ antiporter
VRRPLLLRDLHARHHLELFLVSAVSAVLAIRGYLRLTNYPKVGGESLHIAHMLWGGLLMLAALLVLLAFIGESSRRLAAFAGGVGFGTFIDEVGKFVTHDNDYFFRPAVALIYVVFVLTYLALRSVRRRNATHQEYLVNALQEMEQAAVRDLQAEERDRALQFLSRADARDPLVVGLRQVLERAELRPASAPGILSRSRRTMASRYREVARHPAFAKGLIAFFVAQVLIKLVHVGLVVSGAEPAIVSQLALMNREIEGYSIAEWLQLGSSLLSAGFVALGVAVIRRSRLRGLRMFQRAILVSIFLTQVFMFYHAQWAGLVVLAFNLVVLLGLEFMIEHEERREGDV